MSQPSCGRQTSLRHLIGSIHVARHDPSQDEVLCDLLDLGVVRNHQTWSACGKSNSGGIGFEDGEAFDKWQRGPAAGRHFDRMSICGQ